MTGRRRRAASPEPPEPDLDRLATGRRLRWQPLAAAAAVVAVAAAGATAVALRRPAGPAPAAVASGLALVRDGDTVAGQGSIVALPDRPVQLCTSYLTISIYPEPVPKPCEVAVTVTGLDLDRLTGRRERDGAVWGTARVEGVYRAGTLAVTRQDAYVPAPGSGRPDPAAADPVPCSEPPGGWPRQPADASGLLARLGRAVSRNADEYVGPIVRYPYGWHLQDRSDRKGTEVYVVGTTGDVAAARADLERLIPARHLCVTEVTWSEAAMRSAEKQLNSAGARAVGIGRGTGWVLEDRVAAELLVFDEAASRFLAGVAGGRVEPEPLLRKVG